MGTLGSAFICLCSQKPSYKPPNCERFFHILDRARQLNLTPEDKDKKVAKIMREVDAPKEDTRLPCLRKQATACCGCCGKAVEHAQSLKKCNICRSIRYCNSNCQAMHWLVHKQQCKRLRTGM